MPQVDPAGSDRLSTQGLSMNDSASAFEPMPAGLLSGVSTPIVTQFFALAFDPYSANNNGSAAGGANVSTSGGVTRLAFSAPGGAEIPVAGASVPIRFTLPAVHLTDDREQAVCAYWDTAAKAFSTAGCAGVPNPFPPGHAVAFNATFTAASDADMARAWLIDGPMTNASQCSFQLLDCNADEPGVIFPNPRAPLRFPAVACPPRPNVTNSSGAANATLPPQPVLRVYYGAGCQLWQPNNSAGCWWSNVLQAFTGDGCVRSTAPTQCMCRQCVPVRDPALRLALIAADALRAALTELCSLTDFAAARTPKIETCSLADMTSFSAADIVTKLKVTPWLRAAPVRTHEP
jgi:hypothetical protein